MNSVLHVIKIVKLKSRSNANLNSLLIAINMRADGQFHNKNFPKHRRRHVLMGHANIVSGSDWRTTDGSVHRPDQEATC